VSATKVRLEEVTMGFGDSVVAEDVSLEVREHELLCIVGTSGGGKTTLLRAIGGLKQPRSGAIYVDDEEVCKPRASVAHIFQHFGLFPWKTVRRNVEYGLRVQGRDIDSEWIDSLLETMGLADKADDFPYELSGGMQQRVGIARAFAVEPEVLLMDEPFSALDAITREELQRQLLVLWRSHPHLTAVLVTHDIDEALLLGDRVVVLCGRPGVVGMSVDVPFTRPRDVEQIRFKREYPELRHKIWEALEAGNGHCQGNGLGAAPGAKASGQREPQEVTA
jgi:NitT/TauT family transport system ATP-binding protein